MTHPAPFERPAFSRIHGRRHGRKLRSSQQTRLDHCLPLLRVTPEQLHETGPAQLFREPVDGVWLEIGFGGGEHLAFQAKHNPSVGLIGCEVFENGVVSLLGHIETDDLRNIRISTDDARLILAALPDASIDRVFILFPDPWPKPRHHKRRIISTETMAMLARVMRDGAELRLATDIIDYLRVMLEIAGGHPAFDWMARRPEDWQNRPEDWPRTRYEAKALAADRQPAFLRFVRAARHRAAANNPEEELLKR